jgi:hypothetical protein
MSAAFEDNFDLFPQEEWYEQLLRYGLYVGAAFQLVCILAVVVFPPSSSDQTDENNSGVSFELIIPSTVTKMITVES